MWIFIYIYIYNLYFQVQNFGTLILRSREIDEMLECRLLGISSWNVMGY